MKLAMSRLNGPYRGRDPQTTYVRKQVVTTQTPADRRMPETEYTHTEAQRTKRTAQKHAASHKQRRASHEGEQQAASHEGERQAASHTSGKVAVSGVS